MNIIVITGASSGMGREFAMQLDRGLHRIDEFWLVARRAERMKEMAENMHHPVKILPLDLTNEADMRLFEESLAEEKPVVRMLINCAGYGMVGDFERIPGKEQSGQIDLNCRALVETTHACLPYMRKKSRIIELASSAAFLPQPGFAVYAATKAFVLSFSRGLREELKKREIYVTAVCPGPVDTDFFERAEQYGRMLSVKKLTMAEPERVVRKALCASCRNRPMSVYGLPMQAFWAASRVLPQAPVLWAAERLREKGRTQIHEA
ncbi:MAG: SDR family NAD(P)-dependent oxidoreductase [Eubacteriales bacterium]|nr:SDR family NAD(P)-dependent oxidoreductase [Eubacteriales bacterium]